MKNKISTIKTLNVDQGESDLPKELANPARRALLEAGYKRLEQLTTLHSAEVMELHGIGPNALAQLRRALKAKGLSFADEERNLGWGPE